MMNYRFLLLFFFCLAQGKAFDGLFMSLDTKSFSKKQKKRPLQLKADTLPNQFKTLTRRAVKTIWAGPSNQNLAILLTSFVWIEVFRPSFFKEHKTKLFRDELLKKLLLTEMPEKLHPLGLQPFLDLWYFSKLLSFEYDASIEPEIIKKYINKKTLSEVINPLHALAYWISIEILTFCDNKRYKSLTRHQKKLETIIQQDSIMQGYLLTHKVYYANQFGRKKPTKKEQPLLNEIQQYVACHTIANLPLDLVAELYICFKVFEATGKNEAYKLGNYLAINYADSFQEICTKLSASA